MELLGRLADLRDIVIVVYGLMGIVFFLVAIILVVLVYKALKAALREAKGLVDENVKPALGSIRDAAETVRGTTEFVGRKAITPIVKTYGTFAGVRKGLGVLSALGSRRRRG